MSQGDASATLATGARLGPYEITQKIGAGGMGEIYRARDSRLGRQVAVKVLPAWFSSDPDRLRRFEIEARAAGGLDHPNVLVVHDVGSHEGTEYLVTELLEGESLRERLNRGPLPPRKAVEVAAQIARGLAAAHDKGIVHRDLKPDNVFLTQDGRVKILDFGLAKVSAPLVVDHEGATQTQATALTSPGAILGTVGYLSPEQARGRPADPRSDVFALGAVLYEMMTGRRAFSRDSAVETLNAILKEDPPGISLSGAVPAVIDRILRRCLEKDPNERFQTARDLGFALEALGQGSGSASGPRSAAADSAFGLRWRARWAAVWPVAVGLGLGGLLFALGRQLGNPAANPRITAARALLNGTPGRPMAWVTDGERAYFTVQQDEGWKTYQVPLSGGEPTRITTPTENSLVCDVSRKHSAILVVGWNGTNTWSGDLPVWIIPVPGGSPKRLGIEAYRAAWSPDGQKIAYLGGSRDYGKKKAAVFVAGFDGSSPRQLWLPPDGYLNGVAWSGDGKWLEILHRDDAQGDSWVKEMPADGSRPPSSLVRSVAGSWTLDRRYLVYEVGMNGSRGLGDDRKVNLVVRRRRDALDLRHAPSPAPLSFGPVSLSEPVLSPDGAHILAGGSLTRTEPLLYDPRARQFVRAPGGITGGFIDYSWDGEWVAWVDRGDRTVWRARSNGSERLQITLPPLEAGLVRWSPDGSRLAFVGGRSGDRPEAVYLVPRDGGTLEVVAPPGPVPVWDPCWMPDGRTLVWGNLDSKGPISTLDLGTRRVTPLPGSESMLGPKCSRTGLILAAREWVKGWWVYDPKARSWEDLGPATQNDNVGYPAWSRDGGSIYGLSLAERAILRFDLHRRRFERFAELGAIENASLLWWMGLGRNDAPLILRETGMWDLYVLDWETP